MPTTYRDFDLKKNTHFLEKKVVFFKKKKVFIADFPKFGNFILPDVLFYKKIIKSETFVDQEVGR